MTEVEFNKLKQRHDRAGEELAEARGAAKGLKDQLLSEFGLRTAEEARAKLKELEKRRDAAQRELTKLEQAYRKEFDPA